MAIARVQGNARGVSTTNTITVTMNSTPVDGDLLVACVGSSNNVGAYCTVSSITQTNVNWSTDGAGMQTQSQYSSAKLDTEIWIGIVGSGASKTITITLSGAPVNGGVADVCEYSGLVVSSFLDKTASASGTSTNFVTGTTATTTQASELWIGSIAVYYWGQSNPINDFTLLDGATYTGGGNPVSEAYLEKIVSATGTANSGTSGNNAYYAGCIATFKAAAAGGPTVKKGSSLVNTMTTMLNSKMLFSMANRYPKLSPRQF
jgi:hypothetical protein